MTTQIIDRVSADDLVSLASDVGAAPMQVGAMLLMDGPIDVGQFTDVLDRRVRTVPRLRQRLTPTPPGCGRPIWFDDAEFDISHHVESICWDGPADDGAPLTLAADLIATRLPADRPLWRLTVVSTPHDGRTALIIAFHHVLSDGIGGLAVLANLVDGAVIDGTGLDGNGLFPRPAPTTGALALDAARTRLAALAHLPASARRVCSAVGRLLPASRVRLAPSSLNRPTGPRRSLAVASVDLEAVHRVVHAAGATVNDGVLAAVTGALRRLLQDRGESAMQFVVSIPVSARRVANATSLGNEVGVAPVPLPATGAVGDRLRAIKTVTGVAKANGPVESAAVLGPLFRVLARLGLFQWFINQQRLVHTFVTNLRGPDTQLSILGTPIVDVLPVAMVTGNVTVCFAVLSYAGRLNVSILADPVACPDLGHLRDALQSELEKLAAL